MDSPSQIDLLAYADEAGVLGYTGRLDAAADDQIGLVVAVVIPSARVAEAAAAFEPVFRRFKESAPSGAKLHIADAFGSGNAEWARVAREVRDEAYELIRRLGCPIIFEARRLGELRELRNSIDAASDVAMASRRSPIEVKKTPFNERVDEMLLEVLVQQIDLYAEDSGRTAVEVRFDDLSDGVLKAYRRKILELRSINSAPHKVSGYCRSTGTVHHKELYIRTVGESLEAPRIAGLTVAGKEDPLILLVDIVANSLNAHLRSLPTGQAVDRSGAGGWCLEQQVWPPADKQPQELRCDG